MTIHELFEQHFSRQHDIPVSDIAGHRMGNGSYSIAIYATSFRYFKAGFEANHGEKMQVLGYLSKKGAKSASEGKGAFFYKTPSRNATEAVYVKLCDDHKPGDES